MNQKSYHVAVVGATGAVGEKMLQTLEERDFPIHTISLFSSKRSAGKKKIFKGKEVTIQEATPECFKGVDIALFSAGGSVSLELAPHAVKQGAIVIDNTSAYRMDPMVPLVVPEVNEETLHSHQGIIANPNCSTIQMVVALEPIRQQFGLKKVIVSTYQAVSGAGASAVAELFEQTRQISSNQEPEATILPVKSGAKHYPIAFNAVPQIDQFGEDGFTFEEMKMINETRKIMGDQTLKVAATCVRLPIANGHSESIYIEVEAQSISAEEIKQLLQAAPGIILEDNPAEQIYPMPYFSEGKKDVFVGRIRKDLDEDNGFHLWVVSDNLLKGAAWNSVQIAESLVRLNLV